jgi:transposase
MMQPPLWVPPSANRRELPALVRRVEQLLEMIQMEQNRLEAAQACTRLSITHVLAMLEAELKLTRKAIQDHIDNHPDLKQRSDLLETLPGIGKACIAHLLLAVSGHHGFTHAKQVVAFAGLAPVLRESGQCRGNTPISKTGDSALRKVLYLPALCAKRHNPVIQAFWDRLQGSGKNGKAITCAAMRKLIHIAFGVIKSGKPFDPNYAI